jgi:serine/threonine-protein kinase
MKIGRFEVIDKLAEGGAADIFRARDPHADGRVVVLKRLTAAAAEDIDFVEHFISEIDLCRRFDHPNLVRALDLGEEDGRYFSVLEYVHGVTLENLLLRARDRRQPIPIAVALFVVDQLLAGLGYAHSARSATGEPLGVVHRDVTPSNVFLGMDGSVKLGDFGAALVPGLDDRMPSRITMGKLAYLSPEQCLGDPVDQRSDLFSAAVIFAEALSNTRLFAARPNEQTESVMYRIVEGRRPDVHMLREEVPEGLAALVTKALARKAKDRFSSAASMRGAFAMFIPLGLHGPIALSATINALSAP